MALIAEFSLPIISDPNQPPSPGDSDGLNDKDTC